MTRVTHTYAILQISPAAYREIREKLAAAEYSDQFHDEGDGELIDMHGIAVQANPCPACGGPGIMEGDPTAPADSIRRCDVPCPECRGDA